MPRASLYYRLSGPLSGDPVKIGIHFFILFPPMPRCNMRIIRIRTPQWRTNLEFNGKRVLAEAASQEGCFLCDLSSFAVLFDLIFRWFSPEV